MNIAIFFGIYNFRSQVINRESNFYQVINKVGRVGDFGHKIA